MKGICKWYEQLSIRLYYDGSLNLTLNQRAYVSMHGLARRKVSILSLYEYIYSHSKYYETLRALKSFDN